MVLHLNKLEDALWQVWLKVVQWFMRRDFFHISSMYFRNFVIISILEKNGALHLNKLESSSPKMPCAKFGWNWSSGSWKEDFKILSMYFCYVIIISPWKRAEPFIWTNLGPLHPRMHWVKFGWNWLSDTWGEYF